MLNRRQMLMSLGGGFGTMALRGLLESEARAGESPDSPRNPLASRPAMFPAKAKSVIFLFMYGGPSHVDLFDPKPELERWAGKPIPVFRQEDAFNKGSKNAAMASPYKFAAHGESGVVMSEAFPHLSKCADELCVIRSLHAESNNHGPALFQMQTGNRLSGRPSMGSWVTYGLGSENENLPAFVVLMDHQGSPVNGALNWSSWPTNLPRPASCTDWTIRRRSTSAATACWPGGWSSAACGLCRSIAAATRAPRPGTRTMT